MAAESAETRKGVRSQYRIAMAFMRHHPQLPYYPTLENRIQRIKKTVQTVSFP
jgi:hypothetical protein